MPLGVEINPGSTGGRKRAEQKIKGELKASKRFEKIKPPSIIGKGLATALPKEYKEEYK